MAQDRLAEGHVFQHLHHQNVEMCIRDSHYNDEVVDRFVDKSAENGMDVFRVFDAMNDPRNMAHAMAAVKKAGKHAQGTICYTISPVHTVEGLSLIHI